MNKYYSIDWDGRSTAGKNFAEMWFDRTEHSRGTLEWLVSHAIRDAYEAGVRAERERIAKKLAGLTELP